jgi:hypothetical protein
MGRQRNFILGHWTSRSGLQLGTVQGPPVVAPGGMPGNTVDPDSLLSTAQRDELNRGVERITTFPVDGGWC